MSRDTTTALVTGGSGAIGTAVVRTLLDRGIVERVLVLDRDEPRAGLPDGAEFVPFDLTDRDGGPQAPLRRDERLSALVNVVGGERRPAVAPVDEPAWPPAPVWDDIFELNVAMVYRVTASVVDRLVPGAAVCNVSSIAAAMPWAVSPAYGAAKAALEHWSRTLAVQLADRAVRVNCVRPGFVWSPQWSAVDRAEFERVVTDRVPLRQADSGTPASREQTPECVAAAVAFLCSPDSSHLTGQSIDIDGGAALVRAAR
jgi:3-oxoacyl-[acyl-carrier protein] reductase